MLIEFKLFSPTNWYAKIKSTESRVAEPGQKFYGSGSGSGSDVPVPAPVPVPVPKPVPATFEKNSKKLFFE